MKNDDPKLINWVVDDLEVESTILGEPWRVLVHRPDQLQDGHGLPWVWLLHGRAGSAEDVRPLLASIAAATRDGDLPPAVVVAPDAPDDHRTSWWVDSDYAPITEVGVAPGLRLESSLLDELRPELERRYAGPAGPAHRVAGGISMGGAAALRWLLVRPELFSSAVLLSPAVFAKLPATGSTYRRRDVVDVESSIFDTDVFGRLLHYPSLLTTVDPARTPAQVVVLVGDQEPIRVDDIDRRDLELEAARLHATLKTHPAFMPSLRVVGGGHDWPVWEDGIVTALQILDERASTP